MSIKSRRPDSRPASGWSRRDFVCAGLGLPLLTGCSSDQHSDESGIVDMLGQSFESYTGDGTITRDQARAIPYASIGVSVGGGPQVLLALATQSRGARLWTSSAHIAIETRSGRITRTAGLPHNMSQSGFSGSDPLQTGFRLQTLPNEYLIDLPDRSVYQASVRYAMKSPQRGELRILKAKLDVDHIREKGSCPSLDWQFDNEYWVDRATGFVWQSRQTIHPDLDDVTIAVLRPPK